MVLGQRRSGYHVKQLNGRYGPVPIRLRFSHKDEPTKAPRSETPQDLERKEGVKMAVKQLQLKLGNGLVVVESQESHENNISEEKNVEQLLAS